MTERAPSTQRTDNGRFVSKGSAYFKLEPSGITRDFHFLMLPKMTMLAFSAAVEPLRIANQLTGQCLYRWFLLTEDGNPVRCSNGVSIVADSGIGPIPRDDTLFVCSGVDGYLAASEITLSWLRALSQHGRTVGGVCTGAFTLARAGLLGGRRFTLHWENQAAFEESFPDLPISNQLYCRDGAIITSGGGNACIDMMVSLIKEHHGDDLATRVLDMCLNSEYRVGNKSQRKSIAAEIGIRHAKLVEILADIKDRFSEDLSVEPLASKHSITRRGLERLFKSRLGTSPGEKIREIRLEQANSLLAETDMTIMDISVACGFRSPDSFRKAYRDAFGVTPSARFKMPLVKG